MRNYKPRLSLMCGIFPCMSTHSWPGSWKRANISPLPKVDEPKENGNFPGISVTPVIARALERAVYNTHVRRVMKDHLSSSHFAYREGGNCTTLPEVSRPRALFFSVKTSWPVDKIYLRFLSIFSRSRYRPRTEFFSAFSRQIQTVSKVYKQRQQLLPEMANM